jgi:Ca-activated chloride channel family protein
MFRWFIVLCATALVAVPVQANGLLIPKDADLPPLALVRHEVRVKVVEQVAVTEVTQTFRNHTSRALEATYVFPVPKGASVTRFSMWVNGKEEKGELVEANKARQIYTDVVRRLQDPGLLEYIGSNLLKVRVYPVPANGEQKLRLAFTAVAERSDGLVRYVYPLKTSHKAAKALEKFSLDLTLKSGQPIHNVYSPTHPVRIDHRGDRKVHVSFQRDHATLDRDFELYYSPGGKDIALTALTHRPDADTEGHVMLLLSPRAELAQSHHTPRDFVFVLDTSGSMAGVKMEQARKALKFCLNSLHPGDRFSVLHFATTVTRYRDHLTEATADQVSKACNWVEALQANGGTAINDALAAALDFRPSGTGRTFTVVFFTDGEPTIGEVKPEAILKNTLAKNTANTRIFTFGVGNDVNAVLLDRLAEATRAASTYVRPEEDIEVKVSGLYSRISNPVLTDLKLQASGNVTLDEMYPARLPDLFHGGQLVVLARYKGKGHAAITLTGKVGEQTKEFVYEVDFPARTKNDRAFVEGLWARRKVGYLLDQIRINGEKKELTDEVVSLAKKHGITTPYTSYLVVPDAPATPPVARHLRHPPVYNAPTPPYPLPGEPVSTEATPSSTPPTAFYMSNGTAAPGGAPAPNMIGDCGLGAAARVQSVTSGAVPLAGRAGVKMAESKPSTPTVCKGPATRPTAQAGKEGVDLALQLKALQNADVPCDEAATTHKVAGRTCVKLNDVWTDQGFKSGMPTVQVKALSEAYFRLLEKHPELKEVFTLGTSIIWVAPSGTAVVIDPHQGKEKLDDEEISKLFAAAK